MSERYPGGFITKTPPTPTGGQSGTASGMWNLADVLENVKAGTWPNNDYVFPTLNLFVAGYNATGALGLGDVAYRSSPTQVGSAEWSSIGGNNAGAIAIKSGALYAWGEAFNGVLGDNQIASSRSSPVQIGSLTNWKKVATSGWRSSAAIKLDGTLWVWGENGGGQLGVGDRVARSSPVQVGSDTDWDHVEIGRYGAVGKKTDGTYYVWGAGTDGQQANNDRVSRSSPVQLTVGTTWTDVNIDEASFGIKENGSLWFWGTDSNSGLSGTNANILRRSSPVQIGALTTWSKLSDRASGARTTHAIKTDGTAWGWGAANTGKIGDNNITVVRSSPVQIGAGVTWASILDTNDTLAYGLDTDGALYTWGRNDDGGLGLDDQTQRLVPTQVGALEDYSVDNVNSPAGKESLIILRPS